ncbi:hypothetical protein QPK87_01350 [Kamptonema cortianum]|nr:hypothetical protein [Geitlerinema splendidum]MDK3155234.1 hypothetical protein [Kamptonema cortianum]
MQFEIVVSDEGYYCRSDDSTQMQAFLHRDSKSFVVYGSTSNDSVLANIVSKHYSGLLHTPYLKGLLSSITTNLESQGEFIMMTGRSVLADDGGKVFALPITSTSGNREYREFSASFKGDAYAYVKQTGIKSSGGFEYPESSFEEYRDGRGEFSYEWKLVSAQFGDECPPLPTVEEVLGNQATVQDSRNTDDLFAFGFDQKDGSFESQYQSAKEFHNELMSSGKADRNKVIVAALVACLLTGGASAVLWRRYKG